MVDFDVPVNSAARFAPTLAMVLTPCVSMFVYGISWTIRACAPRFQEISDVQRLIQVSYPLLNDANKVH
jgi:hypothetical protein